MLIASDDGATRRGPDSHGAGGFFPQPRKSLFAPVQGTVVSGDAGVSSFFGTKNGPTLGGCGGDEIARLSTRRCNA